MVCTCGVMCVWCGVDVWCMWYTCGVCGIVCCSMMFVWCMCGVFSVCCMCVLCVCLTSIRIYPIVSHVSILLASQVP